MDDVEGSEAAMHFFSMGWKLLFSLVPPPKMCGGWAAFVGSLCFIALITVVVQEFAVLLGCVLYIPTAVCAITLVALGTSLPDTFASVTAARGSKYADSAVGNITGSNSVNVFLGLGLPWVLACTYRQVTDGINYRQPVSTLAYSVALFLCTSIVCFIVLILRRVFIGGELGGPKLTKIVSSTILVMLWIIYVLMSTLQAYEFIPGF